MWVEGVDVNAFRHPIDFAVLSAHKRFVILRVKGSENGPGEFDVRCGEWYLAAVASGMDVGVYGFSRWTQAPVEWADEFADHCFTIGWRPGDGRPWLDIEAPHAAQAEQRAAFEAMTAAERASWVEGALDTIERRFDRRALIYGSPYFLREAGIGAVAESLATRGLVFPRHSGTPGDITYNGNHLSVAPWPDYVAHQYTSTKPAPGVTGNVDHVAVRPHLYATTFLTRAPR